MRQPVSVLVFPAQLKNGQWEFLLLQRTARPDLTLHSFWQGVTGGLEGEEIPVVAASRELFEETGFADVELHDVELCYSFPLKHEWRHRYASDATEIFEHVFVATIGDGDRLALSDEHCAYQWCDVDQALAKLEFKESRNALEKCVGYLQAR